MGIGFAQVVEGGIAKLGTVLKLDPFEIRAAGEEFLNAMICEVRVVGDLDGPKGA
jgi:hypothetical protein